MFRRTVRIACLVVGLLVTAGLSYRIFQDEETLNREQQAVVAGSSAALDLVDVTEILPRLRILEMQSATLIRIPR